MTSSYLFIFTLNLSVEFAIALAILDTRLWKRIFVMELLLNLATHPLLWWVLPRMPGPYLINLCIAETLVVMAEVSLAVLFMRAHFKRGRIVAAVFAANLATFLMTFLV